MKITQHSTHLPRSFILTRAYMEGLIPDDPSYVGRCIAFPLMILCGHRHPETFRTFGYPNLHDACMRLADISICRPIDLANMPTGSPEARNAIRTYCLWESPIFEPDFDEAPPAAYKYLFDDRLWEDLTEAPDGGTTRLNVDDCQEIMDTLVARFADFATLNRARDVYMQMEDMDEWKMILTRKDAFRGFLDRIDEVECPRLIHLPSINWAAHAFSTEEQQILSRIHLNLPDGTPGAQANAAPAAQADAAQAAPPDAAVAEVAAAQPANGADAASGFPLPAAARAPEEMQRDEAETAPEEMQRDGAETASPVKTVESGKDEEDDEEEEEDLFANEAEYDEEAEASEPPAAEGTMASARKALFEEPATATAMEIDPPSPIAADGVRAPPPQVTALASQAIAISDDPEKFFTGLTRDNFIGFSEDDHIDFMREDMQEYLSSVAPDDFGYLLSLMMSLKPMKIFDLLFTPKAMITWIDDKVNSKPAPSLGTIGSPPADSRPRLYGNGEFHSRRELFRHLVEVKSWEQVGARDKNDGGRRTISSFMRLVFRFSNRTDHTTFLSPARPEDYGQHITEADAIPADISKYVHRSHWITTRKHLVQFVIVSSLPLGKLCFWKYNFMGTTGVQFRKDLNNDNLDVEVLHSYPWESQAAYAICGGQALLGAGNVAREFSLRMSTEGRHDIGTSISAVHGHAQSPNTGLVKSRVWLIMAPAEMIEGLWDKIEIFYPLEGASQSACPMIGSCYIVALRPSSSLPAAEIEAALRFNNKTYSDNSIIMARGLPLQLDPHHTIYGGEPPADGPPSSAVTVAQALLFNETSPP